MFLRLANHALSHSDKSIYECQKCGIGNIAKKCFIKHDHRHYSDEAYFDRSGDHEEIMNMLSKCYDHSVSSDNPAYFDFSSQV